MSTPRERLEQHKAVFRSTPGNEDAFRPTLAASNVDCAIEITEALIGLKVAVDSMANQAFTVMCNLTAASIFSSKDEPGTGREAIRR